MLEEIVVPRKVKRIVSSNYYFDGAFKFCKNLRSVVFEPGSELTEICNRKFYRCESL